MIDVIINNDDQVIFEIFYDLISERIQLTSLLLDKKQVKVIKTKAIRTIRKAKHKEEEV